MRTIWPTDGWARIQRSKVLSNAISLYASYTANYLVPLITVPYTLRVLTPAGYGRGAFALSFASLFGVVAGYGFNLTATRAISAGSRDARTVSRIACEVVCAEAFLLVICFSAYASAVVVVSRLRSDALVMCIAFLVPTFATLSPGWLYQGLEELGFSAKVNVVLRLAYVPALFLFVRGPSDTPAWLCLQAATPTLGTLYLWFHARRCLGVTWVRPQRRAVALRLREGFSVFVSQAAVSLYTVGNTFLVGILSTTTIAGYFSAAEKLVRVALSAWQPLQQAAFPRASSLASQSRVAALRFTRKTLLLQGGLGACLTAGLYVSAPWLVPLVAGVGFQPSITILRILSPLPLLVAISNVLGVQVMVPFRRDKPYMAFLVVGALANVLLSLQFVPRWQGNGMAFSVTCAETIVTVGMLWYLSRARLMPIARLRAETIRA